MRPGRTADALVGCAADAQVGCATDAQVRYDSQELGLLDRPSSCACGSAKVLLSLKNASCLSKTAQTWRGKPANCSDLVNFSGKSFRHGEKIRLHVNAHETTPGYKVTSLKVCLKNAKNLCLGHRFFDKIRQNPPILLHFQAKGTDSLQKSGAAMQSRISCDFMRDETPGTSRKQPCISAPLS